MAQSAITCTPPNPSPPTNFGAGYANTTDIAGSTRPPNISLAATVWNDPWHPGVTNVTHPAANNPSGVTVSTVPPYLDDGTASAAAAFAAPNAGAASEGAGTEVVVTQTYNASVLVPGSAATYLPTGQTPAWAAGDPGGPLRTVSDLGNFTGVSNAPNMQHASSMSPAVNPVLASISPTTTTAGAGTVTVTATGTNFTRQSVITFNGQPVPTTWVSATSMTAVVPKKPAASPTNAVAVSLGGQTMLTPQNLAFT
jgi:hypothetical protein